jgi:cellulose synthase/poly-beta-1,6-N-acetylglucosamine synthase-like glycosyltransferase
LPKCGLRGLRRRLPAAPVFLALLALSALPPLAVLAAALGAPPRLAFWALLALLAYDTATRLLQLGGAWRAHRRRRGDAAAEGPALTITALIPAWNAAATLPRAIDSLLAQAEPPERIVVIDDGSTDTTLPLLAQRYGIDLAAAEPLASSLRHPTLEVLRKPHSGKADSLNRAIACARSDVVLLLDADTWLACGAVRALRRGLAANPGAIAVGGPLIPCCSASLRGRAAAFLQLYEYVSGYVWRLCWGELNATLIVAGACGAFRREVLERAGGFSTRSWTEDHELFFRLHRQRRRRGESCPVLTEPGFMAWTLAPETPAAFLRQRRRWNGGFLETLLQYRRMVGDRRYGALGLLVLVNNTLTVLQPLTLVALLPFGLRLGSAGRADPELARLGLTLLGFEAIGVLLALLTLRLFRLEVGPAGTSYRQALLEALLRPLFFGPLLILGRLWGYASALGRQRSW